MLRERATLAVETPFSLRATVLASGIPDCMPMSWCDGGECFQLIERIGDDVYRVSVTQPSRTRGQTLLGVVIDGPDPASRRAAQVAAVRHRNRATTPGNIVGTLTARVRRVLGLDHPLKEFHAMCRRHPTLQIVPRIGAGRTVRTSTLTEGIIKAICWTNVAWPQAVKMINRVCQLGPALRQSVSLHAWPTPREILRAGDKYLTQVCRLGYRSRFILRFCEDVCTGRVDPEKIERMAASPEVSSDELVARLREVHGVGPSSAHYLLSFLGRHDRLATDSSTVAHVRRAHTNGRKPTFKQIERIYAPYGRWKNLVWWYEMWLTSPTARQFIG